MSLDLSPSRSSDKSCTEEQDSDMSSWGISDLSSQSSQSSQSTQDGHVQTCIENTATVTVNQESSRTSEANNVATSRPQTCRKSTATITETTIPGLSAPSITRLGHSAGRNPFAIRARHLRTQVQRERETPGPGIGKGGIRRMATVIHKTTQRRDASRLRQLRITQHAREYENDIPLLPFQRLVKQIMLEVITPNTYRIQLAALQALRMSCEAFLTQLFEQCSMFTAHAKRVTLMPRDIDLAKRIAYSLSRSMDRW